MLPKSNYPLIYTGFMLVFKRGKRCREILRQNGYILIEFEDLRRDWTYEREIKNIDSISFHELRQLSAQ